MTVAIVFGLPELFIGITTGLTYAMLGVGLVLLYRSSRVLHFGYGEVGAFSAIILAKLVLDGGLSWWLAFPLVIVLGAVLNSGFELLVVRRLFEAPRVVVLVATIGLAQVMFAAQLLLPDIHNRAPFPTPADIEHRFGGFLFRGEHAVVAIVVPLMAVALAWFLNRTVWGVAIRGAAENLDAARLAGVNVRRLSTVVWALGGALAATTFVLLLPMRGFVFGASSAAVGPTLLLRALAVGLVGRMVSLPMTVVGGIAFGILEAALYANVSSPGAVDMAIFVLVLVLLLARRAVASHEEAAFVSRRSSAGALSGRARSIGWGAVSIVAVGVPFVLTDPGQHYVLARIVVFALIGMSVTVITGWSGQLSLAQFAFVGVGAVVTAGLGDRGMSFGWSVFFGAALAAAAAVLVGFPALRIRGLFLAVGTLGFAVAARGWILDQEFIFGDDRQAIVERARLGPIDFATQRSYYFLCLAVLTIVALLLRQVGSSGVGRMIVAVRENESAASAFTLSPSAVKLTAFALSGAVAGLAGGFLAGLDVTFRPFDFGPERSILVLAMTVIGGVTSLAGATLGAIVIVGIPAWTAPWIRQIFRSPDVFGLLLGGVGVMFTLVHSRGGLIELLDHRLRRLHGRPESAPEPTGADPLPPADEVPSGQMPARGVRARAVDRATADRVGEPILECEALEVRFGGLVANRDVSLALQRGEILGLIGTNGAGKSTLMDAIGGYVTVSNGEVRIFGENVTSWLPHERAQLGLGRVFQDAKLFGDLEVRECVLVALESQERSEFFPSLLALPPARRAERAKSVLADELLDLTGMGEYRGRRVTELSTGMRRICELTCLMATGAEVVLLDEPTGGIAQREVEAFAQVILDVKVSLEASMIVIEHDMPFVMGLSDRIVCMSAGEVIADGRPEAVRGDPRVIATYLGTNQTAIARSDTRRSPNAEGRQTNERPSRGQFDAVTGTRTARQGHDE